MCNENTTQILSLDFSSTNDTLNWQKNTGDICQYIGNKLVLKGNSTINFFKRLIGNTTSGNNRLKIDCLFEVEKTINSPEGFKVIFQILDFSNNVVFEGYEDIDLSLQNTLYKFYFERIIKFTSPINDMKINIKIEGLDNEVRLLKLNASDYKYCYENQRAYFLIEELINNGIKAKYGIFNCKSFKVGGIETLTPEFFNENTNNVFEPLIDWFFAKSELDGSNREANTTEATLFNPFIKGCGLTFDNSNYFSGQATSVTSGSNYGPEIMKIGTDKPLVYSNAPQHPFKKGAFYVDIDFSKDLFIEFEIVFSDDINVFDRPTYWRKYRITFDSKKCITGYYFHDELTGQNINRAHEGFLQGIAGSTQNNNQVNTGYKILEGDCLFVDNSQEYSVYIQNAGTNYTPQPFQILFTDQNFTQPFNGNDQKYRMKYYNSNFLQNVSFRVSPLGMIYNLELCSGI